MRWTSVIVVVLFLLSLLPLASAEFGTLSTNTSIILVRGDYSSGTLVLTNNAGVSYSVVSFQRYWVESENGSTVGGFNFTMFPTVFSHWSSGSSNTVSYNLSCSPNVPPGNYTLHLRFIATTSTTGQVLILNAIVPIKVLSSPLKFLRAQTYVPGRGEYSYVFVGEKLIVYSHILNIGHKTVKVRASVKLLHSGIPYYTKENTAMIPPGDTLIKFAVPIGINYPTGSYLLVYTLSYGNQSYIFKKEFTVLTGVKLISVSIQSERVLLGSPDEAYLTILSERNVTVELLTEVFKGKEKVASEHKEVQLSPGTEVMGIQLPTNVSGNITASFKLFIGTRLVSSKSLSYSVLSPPGITALKKRVLNDTVVFRVVVSNSWSETQGVLSYRIESGGKVLYQDSLLRVLPHGNITFTFSFKIPTGQNVSYVFTLKALGHSSSVKGVLYIPSPSTPTKTTTTTTTSLQSNTSSSSTTSASSGGSGALWVGVGIAVIIAVIVVVWYYYNNLSSRKRRRKRPKRRSPLGRFKRPKPPKFHERNSLPKKK
ncbi:hypothetical protein [Thermococcus sp.]